MVSQNWSRKLFKVALVATILAFAGSTLARDTAPEAGDLVRITVYGQPDLTTATRVDVDGYVQFPFIGRVQIGNGLSTEEAAENIARGLEDKGIVRNPQVNLLVSEKSLVEEKLVTILGQVERPGRYPLPEDPGMGSGSLIELLATAGGANPSAGTRVSVFRRVDSGDEQRIDIDISQVMQGVSLADGNLILERGDVVVVPTTDVFYVYGQVRKPGRYPLFPNMLVMQAISVSGGITERGSERDITVTRPQGNGHKARAIKLNDALKPGDVIYVKERFF